MTDNTNVFSIKRAAGETYKAMHYCQNCGNQFTTEVAKGTLATKVAWTCPTCGCTKEQIDKEINEQRSQLGLSPVQVARF